MSRTRSVHHSLSEGDINVGPLYTLDLDYAPDQVMDFRCKILTEEKIKYTPGELKVTLVPRYASAIYLGPRAI